MKPEEIHITDWKRILIGEVPGSFYIEIAIRGFFIYILLIASLRLMGKRMSIQLSRNELVALVSLAAAIGVPLQSPDRGLLPAVVIAVIVVLGERWISAKAFSNQKFEKYTQGNISMLIKNSVIDVREMLKARLTPQRLKAQLRSQGIKQLGEIKRFYIEANGSFTLIKNEKAGPGLSVIPRWDQEYYDLQKKSEDIYACSHCGNLREKSNGLDASCSNCNKRMWIPAALN